MIKSYSEAANRQQNWERQQGHSCHASRSEVEKARWAEKEIEWELDAILDKYPDIDYDELSEKLCIYAYTNNLGDVLFRDVCAVIKEVMNKGVHNE